MVAKRLKDVDSADVAYRLKAATWSFTVGFGGAAAGVAWTVAHGGNALVYGIGGFLVGGLGTYFGTLGVVARGAKLAENVYAPDGASTPHKREYSQAESLVARGRYEEAAVAFEIHCAEYPEDPDPYFRLARLYAGKMERYEEAVFWWRRARKDAKVTPSEDLVALQEVIEILLHKLRDPRKAIPEMAALAQRHPATPAGQAAAKELALMRELLQQEHDGGANFTEEFLARAVRQPGDPT